MREYVLRFLGEVTKSTITEDPRIVPTANETESNTTGITIDNDAGVDDEIFMGVTSSERIMDLVFGIAFLFTAIFAAKKMSWNHQQAGAETTVVTAFYFLILLTSVFRSVWFLIPKTVWVPSYTPVAIFAFDEDHPAWMGAFLSEFVLTAGSLSLLSIFILILVYWADVLKKYFYPNAPRRSIPMVTFLSLVSFLVVLEMINVTCFFCRLYTTEGMILANSALLAVLSGVCVCEITIFSHRFITVLKTLGAINQVSTDSQINRIVWIAVTGNMFFFTRAALEIVFCAYVFLYWEHERTVARAFTHPWWDTYVGIKFLSEVTILTLMCCILESRFARGDGDGDGSTRPTGYVSVPNNEGATADGSGSDGKSKIQSINV